MSSNGSVPTRVDNRRNRKPASSRAQRSAAHTAVPPPSRLHTAPRRPLPFSYRLDASPSSQLARVRSYEALVEAQRGGRDAERVRVGAIAIAPGPRLGSNVLTASDVSVRYGDRLLFDGLSFELPPGAIMGVVGANGTGARCHRSSHATHVNSALITLALTLASSQN
jgi:ATPase subunit of ABC transporter with duplicated ATPase domains